MSQPVFVGAAIVVTALLCWNCGPVPSTNLQEKGFLGHYWEKEGMLTIDKPATASSEDFPELFQAVKDNHLGEVLDLMERGADPNKTNEAGETVLELAVTADNRDMVMVFLDGGAVPTVDAVSAGVGHTQTAILNDLLAKNVDLNRFNRDGSTPLIRAVRWGDPKLVRLLLDNGASVDMLDTGGDGPISFAAQAENLGQHSGWEDLYLSITEMLKAQRAAKLREKAQQR